ncbi:MAG TPA: hypothetical protein VIK01_02485 [Polyangiaceae bacterium]
MTSHLLRPLLLVPVLTLVAVASCGGDDKKLVDHGTAGDAGANDTGGQSSAQAGNSAGGSSGPGGADATAGASTAAGGAGAAPSSAGGVSGTDVGGADGIDPIIDVGAGCNPPPALPRLSATAAGLPADGLVLWLRADRGVYATDAQRVCAWADQSGQGHLLLASGEARPLFEATSLGARPAIHFDAANSYLSVDGVLDIPPTSARTYVAVVQLVNTYARFQSVMQGEAKTPGTYMAIDANTFGTNGGLEGVYTTSTSYDTTLATSATPRVHVMTITTMVPGTDTVSAVSYRVNSAAQTLVRASGKLGNIEDFSAANFTMVGNGATAIMAEALIYDRALSVAESGVVEQALMARYGIP